MVQYSIIPWRHASDLLSIRSAFYPFGDPSSPHAIHQTSLLSQGSAECSSQTAILNAAKSRAISLVSLYVERGNCPHLLASTSLLVSASLLDTQSQGDRTGRHWRQSDALKCAYAASFGRFVTGLLDGYQSKKHKMSMYAIAKTIGLPSTFVELRHQCTHEDLPSIGRLRKAVQDSLVWLWGGYWEGLGEWTEKGSLVAEVPVGLLVSEQLAERMNVIDEIDREDEESAYTLLEQQLSEENDLMEVVRRYLLWKGEDDTDQHIRMIYSRRLLPEKMEDKLEALEQLRDCADSTLMLASIKLFREVMNGEADPEIFAEEGEEEEDVDITRNLVGKIDSDDVEPPEDAQGQDGRQSKRQRMMSEENPLAEEDEEEKEEGWQMWEGPWVAKPIGIV